MKLITLKATFDPHCAAHLSPPLRAQDGGRNGTTLRPTRRGASEPTSECVIVPNTETKTEEIGLNIRDP